MKPAHPVYATRRNTVCLAYLLAVALAQQALAGGTAPFATAGVESPWPGTSAWLCVLGVATVTLWSLLRLANRSSAPAVADASASPLSMEQAPSSGPASIPAKRNRPRIYLSPPDIDGDERKLVEEAFEANWIAPVGPHLDAFESEVSAASGASAAVCLSSGTAALHLAVRLLGIQPGDEVLCSSFTFIASAAPVCQEGGVPIFVDSERASWNMDPSLLAEALAERARRGKLPRAIVVTDLYGQCAQWDEILKLAGDYGVPVIEDAAEAMGATYKGTWAGRFGLIGVYSFNGNKIITTSGGGMMVSQDRSLIERAKKLSTQAREPVAHYEHVERGYNYRMSNVLAGIGRGQFRNLEKKVLRRRDIFERYRQSLGDLPGIEFMPELPAGRSNRWLTCVTISDERKDVTPARVLETLAADNIEGRALWKPLHLQPVFSGAPAIGGGVCEDLYRRGLCLPSGSSLDEPGFERVVAAVRKAFRA